MNKLSIDELNIIEYSKMKSIPYEEYFGEMDLTDEQKQERIDMARKLEDKLTYIMFLVLTMSAVGAVDYEYVHSQLVTEYQNVLIEAQMLDDYFAFYVSQFADNFIDTTQKHISEDYYLSYDRAAYNAENESNAIFNHQDLMKAIEKGYTHKKWITMNDRRVRHTHRLVDGETIPIEDEFQVGNAKMLYPKMECEYPEEVVNCRCTLHYIKGNKEVKQV